MCESGQPLDRVGYRPEAPFLSFSSSSARTTLRTKLLSQSTEHPRCNKTSVGTCKGPGGGAWMFSVLSSNLSSTPPAAWQLPNPIPLHFHVGCTVKYRGLNGKITVDQQSTKLQPPSLPFPLISELAPALILINFPKVTPLSISLKKKQKKVKALIANKEPVQVFPPAPHKTNRHL